MEIFRRKSFAHSIRMHSLALDSVHSRSPHLSSLAVMPPKSTRGGSQPLKYTSFNVSTLAPYASRCCTDPTPTRQVVGYLKSVPTSLLLSHSTR